MARLKLHSRQRLAGYMIALWGVFGPATQVIAEDNTVSLTVSGGSQLNLGYALIDNISGEFGSEYGLLVVDGTGSAANADFVAVGIEGRGEINVKNGAQLNSQSAFLGFYPGALGMVNVNGVNSAWQNGPEYDFFIGYAGAGDIVVSDGGLIKNDTDTYLGVDIGGAGRILVDGINSRFVSGGQLFVGWEGHGEVAIKNGGKVLSTDAFMPGQQGSVTIDGAGSALLVNGNLDVGRFSRNALGGNEITIQNGGALNVQNWMTIGEESKAILIDGSINTGMPLVNYGILDISGTSEISGYVDNIGKINIAKDSVVKFSNYSGSGEGMFVDENSQVIFSGNTFFGNIDGTGTVVSIGHVSLPAKHDIEGNLILGSSSNIEFPTYNPYEVFGRVNYVNVGGTLELGGSLGFSFWPPRDPYEPQFGDVFDLFIAGSIIGDFDQILYPTFANGLHFQLTQFVDPDSNKHILRATVVPIPGLAWLFAPISFVLLLRKRH